MQKTINDYLKRWGKNPHGEPIVRLVWSDSQREVRLGEYNDFYGDIFLRTVKEARVVPKYSWIHERWILERWFPPDVTINPELPETAFKGSYEPIYVFQDKKGDALQLSLRVVELICSAMFNQPPAGQQIRDELAAGLDREDDAMQKYYEDALEISTPIQSKLSLGEAVAFGKHRGGQ